MPPIFDTHIDGSLNSFFNEHGFKTSWDYDKEYRWIEVYKDDKLIIQIEPVSVEKFIDLMVKHIKSMEEEVFFDPDFFFATDLDAEELKDFALIFNEIKDKI